MYDILDRQEVAPGAFLYELDAPLVAKKAKAGQFVIVMGTEEGERLPMTIADWDRERGLITIIIQRAGQGTRHLVRLQEGDHFYAVAGPLGNPTHIENYGTVACVGGGLGIAPIYPIARSLKEAGNRVISIIGAKSEGFLFWEDRLASVSDKLVVCTDDGTKGYHGFVSGALKELLDAGDKIDHAVAIGPAVMMRSVAQTTKPYGVSTTVSLNSIMVDGTGMCGGCRVEVGGVTKFTCVDGPDFDAHQVDWDLLLTRQRTYRDEEAAAITSCNCEACHVF